MLTALTFAHFSSKLLLKKQMIIPVKKNVKQRWSYRHKIDRFLRNLTKKNPAKSAVFYWLFLGEVSPWNFPWNGRFFYEFAPENPSKFDFFPLKRHEISRFFCKFWLFPAKILQNQQIFPQILAFFPWKSREIGRFFREFAPENPAKFCFFFPWNIRSPDCSKIKSQRFLFDYCFPIITYCQVNR